MELVLVRHGQPAWADADGFAQNDPGLSDLGHEQAAAVAARLARPESPPVDQLVVSTMRRAVETARPISRALRLEPAAAMWLPEIGLPPDWDGVPEDQVVGTLSELRLRHRDDWWDGVPGGESFTDFHARVTRGLEQMLAVNGVGRHPGDPEHLWTVPQDGPRIVVVAHNGSNSVMVSHLLGIEPQPWEWERFNSDHAAITVLRSAEVASGHIWSLQYFSDVAHLWDLEITH